MGRAARRRWQGLGCVAAGWALLLPGWCAAQATDPRTQYVEWPVRSETLQCDPIAVNPELDERLRRHEASGVTRLFAIVAADHQLRILNPASASGTEADHLIIDRLLRDRLHKCRARTGPYDLLLEARWDFARGLPIEITTRAARPQDLRPPVVQLDHCARPPYPREAARRGEQGFTRLALVVDGTGRVVKARVVSSSGSELLDAAAQAALLLCTVTPAMLRDEPLGGFSSVQSEYIWRLQ